jgi:hypothetical protein
MTRVFPTILRRVLALGAFGALLCGTLTFPDEAHARVFVGFGFPLVFGPPAYYPPPVYYPPPPFYPPPYYPPPPGYSAPPASYMSRPGGPSGQACYAGGTVCPMERPVGSGSSCYCTTGQGRVWGRAS